MVHTMDYLLTEMHNKLELAQMLKVQYGQDEERARVNIERVKEEIDEAIAYHIESLRKRGNWLKMHAVQMHDVMVESLSQKQKQMEEITSHINKSIQDTDTSETYNEKDMRQLINSVLTQVELPACAENATLTFDANNSSLCESILAFGSLSTTPKDDITESFVLTDGEESDDGIEIVSKVESMINKNHLCDWLFERSNALPKQRELNEITSPKGERGDMLSDWLCVPSKNINSDSNDSVACDSVTWLRLTSSDGDSGRSSPICLIRPEQKQKDDDCAIYLLKNLRQNVVNDDCDSLNQHQYLHPTARNAQAYKYPVREFLKEFDELDGRSMSEYLVERKAESVASHITDDTCKWLYRKDNCKTEQCTPDGCDLFDKNWLHTVQDW